uniref:Uncharacterized protein n=1 Tax=Nelumbo nucifera TaxID=4432 RepID=A0A822XIY4_NELNU|nr:TPA_asm: hypothetical protein HUJ06_022937 [Nelumbo nucifera]
MPKQVLRLHQVLLAQELIAANSFHLSVEVMDKHMRLPISASLAPRQHSRCEDRRHAARRRRVIATRSVHQYHIPSNLVQVIREVVDPQLTVGEE